MDFKSEYHYFPRPITQSKLDYLWYFQAESPARLPSNHISDVKFGRFPLSLGIETKKTSGDTAKADRQIALWQAAQWEFFSKVTPYGVSELPFLPGIIVDGNIWKFVATTWQDGKTVF